MKDEHEAISSIRKTLGESEYLDFVVEPVWFDGDSLLILRAAPESAVNLSDQLALGIWDAELLCRLGEGIAQIHAATWDRRDLRSEFAFRSGFQQVKIDIQLRKAHPDPLVSRRMSAFIKRSLQHHSHALLHGDLAPKNIMVWEPKRFLLIDFEESGFGDPALDVGYLLAHLRIEGIKQGILESAGELGTSLIEAYLECLLAMKALQGRLDVTALLGRIEAYIGISMLSRVHSPAAFNDVTKSNRSKIEEDGQRMWSTGAKGT